MQYNFSIEWDTELSKEVVLAQKIGELYLCDTKTKKEKDSLEKDMIRILETSCAKVRYVLADILSNYPSCSEYIIDFFLSDQVHIAGLVLARSPILCDDDLIHSIRLNSMLAAYVAQRKTISARVCSAIIESQEYKASYFLLENAAKNIQVHISSSHFYEIFQSYAQHASIRNLLVQDLRTPHTLRYKILMKTKNILGKAKFVKHILGKRGSYLLDQICIKKILFLIDQCSKEETVFLVQEMKENMFITQSFFLQAIVAHKIDFIVIVLSVLSGISEKRIKNFIYNGQDTVLISLLAEVGIEKRLYHIILQAFSLWRQAKKERSHLDSSQISGAMLHSIAYSNDNQDLFCFLKSIHYEALRKKVLKREEAA